MITRFPTTSVYRSGCLLSATSQFFCRVKLSSLPLAIRKNVSRSTTNYAHATALAKSLNVRAGYFYTNAVLEKSANSMEIGSSISPNIPKTFRNKALDPSLESRHERQYVREPAASTEDFLPPNITTSLSVTASLYSKNSVRRVCSALFALSKPRLTILVVLTPCASYALYPVPELLLPSSTSTHSLSPLTLFFLTTGTALCAASANTFNMLYEPQWDALMLRTRNRPLVRGLISTLLASIFATAAGTMGVISLYYGVNPTVSIIGLINIALYAGVYTPLKRVSVINTWVGAMVGALPPLMGWAAAAGQRAIDESDWSQLLLGEQNIGGWLLASLLFAWQFPHFMSLSWSVRGEYKKAGYKMLCWVNPARNARVALRYSILFIPICAGMSYFNVTENSYIYISTPINAWILFQAVKFWRYEGARGSARSLFWASVWHLPVIMILAMVLKKGMWQKVSRAFFIDGDEDEIDDEITM